MSFLLVTKAGRKSGCVIFECDVGAVLEINSIAVRELIDSGVERGRNFLLFFSGYLTAPPFR